jgi:asparagine synthase (glutamine-hydrolysing)
MLRSVEKIEPGEWRRFGQGGAEQSERFYRLPLSRPQQGRGDQELIEGTADALRTAVERQLLADVEVGAFLSGGLDSSAIVAFAARQAKAGRFNCFTIDYASEGDEAGELVPDLPYARRAAEHLGVDLHEIRVDASMADDFERLVYHLDEPEADPAALNSLYISALARRHGIKVLLSGTGGDDLFTGYRRHKAVRLDRLWDFVPGPVRRGLHSATSRLPSSPTSLRRVRKLFEAAAGDRDQRLAGLFEWLPVDQAVALLSAPGTAAADVRRPLMDCLDETRGQPPVERLLQLDQRFFLIDHNLNYTDKTGMAHGVEIRVPFLDPDLVDWAAGLPTSAKLRGGETKWVLRKAMEPYLPNDIIYRPKTGFGVPLRAWLKGRMRPMMEELLDRKTVEDRGLFDPAAVAALREDTLSGRRDGSYTLLGLMAIELWCRNFLTPAEGATAPEPAPAASILAPSVGAAAE